METVRYETEKHFTPEQVQKLFISVGWESGQYPKRLYKALMNSETVISVWDNDRLVALARAIDDSEMLAYVHYVLVDPEYQGMGIAGKMVEMIKEKYKDYLYIHIMPHEKKNVSFYEKYGFKIVDMGEAMETVNPGEKY